MIIFEPLGGLGNQLFAYGIGLAIASRLQSELWADLRNFENYEWHSYELGSFTNSIVGQLGVPESFPQTAGNLWGSFRGRADSRWRAGNREAVFSEESSLFEARFAEVQDGSRLRGYFQSWKYLESVGSLLDDQLWSLTNPTPWFQRQKLELQNKPPWVGVHLRLGNYQSLPTMGVAADIYYRRSLRLLKDLGHELRLVVFTDSPELIRHREIFDEDMELEIFDSSSAGSSLETILLMSLAHHLVIGNSTFSWWAGWLGRHNAMRRIIYPRPWLDLKSWDDRDLPYPGWIGMSRETTPTERGF